MTDDSEVARIAAGLKSSDAEYLGSSWKGYGALSPDSSLRRMQEAGLISIRFTKRADGRWSRWKSSPTEFGLAVHAHLQSKGGDA